MVVNRGGDALLTRCDDISSVYYSASSCLSRDLKKERPLQMQLQIFVRRSIILILISNSTQQQQQWRSLLNLLQLSPPPFFWIATPPCMDVHVSYKISMITSFLADRGFSFEDVLFLNPPGQEMDGGAGDMSVKWTSKYVSVWYCVVCVLL